MPNPTKTLNPLPFEHLDPRRFEDLVRQLAYDFRIWRALEATGRSGGDEGYDIRGWEVRPDSDTEELNSDAGAPEGSPPLEGDREWLIQCKREKAIGPAKLRNYLDEIGEETLGKLYGLVFSCSCDVSKKSRDIFREACRNAGLSECYIWSRGELEDMLFQPKNDGLLFAYFGISLKIRKRTIKMGLRSRLAIKRKIFNAFGSGQYLNDLVLLRDPEDDKYPYLSEGLDREEHFWIVKAVTGIHPRGLEVKLGEYFAYLAKDGVGWDAADVLNIAFSHSDDPWSDEHNWPRQSPAGKFSEEHLEAECRGTLTLTGLLQFEDIIEVDQDGDSAFEHPHIFVQFKDRYPPYRHVWGNLTVPPVYEAGEKGGYRQIAEARTVDLHSETENRLKVFPEEFRRFAAE